VDVEIRVWNRCGTSIRLKSQSSAPGVVIGRAPGVVAPSRGIDATAPDNPGPAMALALETGRMLGRQTLRNPERTCN
jgi:hypothetical protein